MWLKRCLFRVLAKPRIKNKKDMKQQDAALVCFSGGQDSTTCLFWAKKHFSRVEAVCFTYGQKHSLEIEVARKIAADADVPFQLLDVSLISQLDPNCSLTRWINRSRRIAIRIRLCPAVIWYSLLSPLS